MKKLSYLIAAVVLAVSANFFIAQAANYTITVNAGTRGAAWNRFYEGGVSTCHMNTVLQTNAAYAGGRGIKNALKLAHDSAGIKYCRGHGILDDDVGVYVSAGTYSWTRFDRIEDSIRDAGMRPIVEIGFMPGPLATAKTCITNQWYNGVCGYSCGPTSWTEWENLIKALIAHCETRYGAAEVRNWYFEVWNEVSWMYACGGGETGYLTLYDHTAAAFTAQDPLCKIGGPAGSADNMYFIPTFINHCKNNNIKLDFITWHAYGNNGSGPDNNATNLYNYHVTAVNDCNNNGFSGPIICTEFGNSYTKWCTCHDNETGASFTARLVHLINSNGATYRQPVALSWWAVSDLYEEDNLTGANPAFAGVFGMLGRGVAGNTQSWDIPKPVFNAFKLLHKLNAYSLTLSGAGGYVNGVATISAANDTVSVLIYSQIDNATGNSATSDNVVLTITGIPTTAGITTATMKHWVVDRTHSNAYRAWVDAGSPNPPSTAQWTTIAAAGQLQTYDTPGTVTLGGTTGAATYSKPIVQYYYSVGLVQLTNFSATAVSRPPRKAADFIARIDARVAEKNIIIDLPSAAPYTVWLYSVNGQMVLSKQIAGRGTNVLSLANVPAGVYTLECTGCSQSFVKKIIVGR